MSKVPCHMSECIKMIKWFMMVCLVNIESDIFLENIGNRVQDHMTL